MTAAIFTLLGVLIGFVGTLVSTIITKRSEERRHYRQLAVQAATEKFKLENAMALEVAKAGGHVPPTTPFDAYVIHTIRLMEIAQDTSLSADQVVARLTDLAEFTKAATGVMKAKKQTEIQSQP